MTELFLKIVNMSISASWLVLAVLSLRLVLKKAPKWANVLLWGIVAVRLLCPYSIESVLSLIPSAETISPDIMMDRTPEITTGVSSLNRVINPIISASFAPDPSASANPLQIWIPVASLIWLLGVLGLLIYTAASYWRLRCKVHTAVILRNNIFLSENVSSPFVLGIIRPKIYLPYNLSAQDLEHVIAHERAHIRRKDHWWKPLGFLLLTIHWFNPLMWAAFMLLCRDIELACDERVIRDLGNDQRADYTQALVSCSVNRRMIAACPLAFGEVGVKERVKSVMNYKKPAFWVIVISVVVCAAVAVCFLTNPPPNKNSSVLEDHHSVIKWLDYTDDPSGMDWDNELTIEIPEFPGVTFRYTPDQIVASKSFDGTDLDGHSILIAGMPIWNAYFCDLTGDGLPEICSSLSMGSGMIDNRVTVHDYANGVSYELIDRGNYDYYLRMNNEDGYLYVDKKNYNSDELVSSGRLVFKNNCIQIEELSSESETYPKQSFEAEILEIRDNYFLVKPVEGSRERSSADKIEVPMKNMDASLEPQVGDIIQIEYSGALLETYPARVSEVYRISVKEEVVYGYEPNDRDAPSYYLTVAREGVYSIEITTLNSSGGCIHADGTPFQYGEEVYLEPLDGLTDLRGITVSALDEDGNHIFAVSIPKYEGSEPLNVVICGEWIIAPAE